MKPTLSSFIIFHPGFNKDLKSGMFDESVYLYDVDHRPETPTIDESFVLSITPAVNDNRIITYHYDDPFNAHQDIQKASKMYGIVFTLYGQEPEIKGTIKETGELF